MKRFSFILFTLFLLGTLLSIKQDSLYSQDFDDHFDEEEEYIIIDADEDDDMEDLFALEADELMLTIVGTNDVHGWLEEREKNNGDTLGGMYWFSGYMSALRKAMQKQYGSKQKVLLLDAGDVAQGTLLSNYSEGQVAVSVMNKLDYTAAVAGNHGYDFGPLGWLNDSCDEDDPDCDPLEALTEAVSLANFPFLGTNVTYKDTGDFVDFLPPYEIVEFQGRGIAIFGMDNAMTNRLTSPENVKDLSFTNGVQELQDFIEAMWESEMADVFVLTIHDGDSITGRHMKSFLEGLPDRSTGDPLLDAVVCGHTHILNKNSANGTPYIQSYSKGEYFGIIQLLLSQDADSGRLRVLREYTRKQAGVQINPDRNSYFDQPIKPNEDVLDILIEARDEISDIADEHLGVASGPFSKKNGRIKDSLIGNLLTDMMRKSTGAEAAVYNAGGIRAPLPEGDIYYEDLFAVLPFNAKHVRMREVPMDRLVSNLNKSIKSCGRRGALQISGFRIVFERDCGGAESTEFIDQFALLLKIISNDNKLLWEMTDSGPVTHKETIDVVTSDYVKGGGSGYDAFKDLPIDDDPTDVREDVADQMLEEETFDPDDYRRSRYINCLTEVHAFSGDCI